MLTIFAVSFFSVLKIFLVCLAGTWLARRGLMNAAFRRSLSLAVMTLMLPCLLVTKLSASIDAENLLQWAGIPFCSFVYVLLGFAVGFVALAIVRPPKELSRVMMTTMAFGNSGFIPYPLIMAIAATAPFFRNDPGAADRGVAYVSVYLVGFSPCLWAIGYPYLAHKPWRELKWNQILSPPVLSVIAGIALGLIPPLRRLFVEPDGPLRILLDAGSLIGQAAIPCALLVLGANLADTPKAEHEFTPLSVLLTVAWGRLVLMPLIGCVVALGFWRLGLVPRDPVCLLVLLIETAVPPATNLIIMCQSHNRGEAAMSRVFVTTYVLAVPTLTFFVSVYLWIIETV